jgi:hydroxyethylthiazole kinase-like uncharacterized protein yjeF
MGVSSKALLKKRFKSWLPQRKPDSHKNDFGHVLVIGGSRGMMGAPRLAALGALRGGAGLLTMGVPQALEPLAAMGPWEAMTLSLPDRNGSVVPGAVQTVRSFLGPKRVSSVALGPGLGMGRDVEGFIRQLLLTLSLPTVLDADGLNALARLGPLRRFPPMILTPHPGEMARLLCVPTANIQKDRAFAAREAALRFRSIVVLKGHQTIVTDGDHLFVNGTGNPGMATGGTGDVLAGLIAALLAQVAADDAPQRLWRAAVLGVHLHGRAGDLAEAKKGAVSLLAGDVVAHLPEAFRELCGK